MRNGDTRQNRAGPVDPTSAGVRRIVAGPAWKIDAPGVATAAWSRLAYGNAEPIRLPLLHRFGSTPTPVLRAER